MVIVTLIMAFIIEIAFAVYCIYSKSNQKKLRSIVRISTFATFIILLLISVIKWSFRWKALAVLLLIWAVIGALTLIRNKEDTNEYKHGRVIRKTIISQMLIFAMLAPALVFPEYESIGTTGEYKVATAFYTYIDENRIETYTDTNENRKVNIEFWYPENAEEDTYPLIVFSHGSFGIKSSNESLCNELASHGYVVCSIDHTYQSLYTADVYGNKAWINMGYMNELFAEDAKSNKQQSYEYFRKWMGIRTGDIDFVINYILKKSENNYADKIYKIVDTTKIGVMGHSLGGSAALGIGRSRNDVSAVIALEAPFMCDIKGVENGEFIWNDEIYPVPVLNVYSDSSWSHLSEWSQYAKNYALLSDTKATAFNTYIKGVGHLMLTDLALASPFFTDILNGQKSEQDIEYCLKTINKLTLEFFNSYLKGKGEFIPQETY